MHYLDLNSITARHLYGTWEVPERLAGPASDASAFAKCSRIVFGEDGKLKVAQGKNLDGTWELFMEKEIIYNPQLNFTFPGQPESFNAIITRYREDDEETSRSLKVTLYFTSGLELVLEQKHPKAG